MMNLIKLKNQKKNVDREKLFYKRKTDTYDFRIFQTIGTFDYDIYNGEITLKEANESQAKLAEEIRNFMNKTKPKKTENKKEKEVVSKNLKNFL